MKFLNNFALFAILLSILTLPFGVMGIAGVSIPSQEVLPASTVYKEEAKDYIEDPPVLLESTPSLEITEP